MACSRCNQPQDDKTQITILMACSTQANGTHHKTTQHRLQVLMACSNWNTPRDDKTQVVETYQLQEQHNTNRKLRLTKKAQPAYIHSFTRRVFSHENYEFCVDEYLKNRQCLGFSIESLSENVALSQSVFALSQSFILLIQSVVVK